MNITREFVLKARTTLNMTASQLAKKLDCCPRSIYRWESGKIMPKGDVILNIVKLCKERGINLDDLFPFF